MSKYISAELIKDLMKHDRFMQGNAEWVMWQQEVDRRVDNMPSIDIVRCRDCKWSDFSERDKVYVCKCHIPHFSKRPNGYCDLGERRDDVSDNRGAAAPDRD